MKYIGITQKTANWFLSNVANLNALKRELLSLTACKGIFDGVIVVGSLRIAGDRTNQLLCIWNSDYLSGTLNEEWGFIKLDAPLGLYETPAIIEEVLEHEIYVINQRLQGLMLNENFKHRPHENNISTCLAGRGEIAWHQSIGYFEDVIATSSARSRSIVCVGPSAYDGYDLIKKVTGEAGAMLPKLVSAANNLLGLSINRPALDVSAFIGIKDRFAPDSTTESEATIITTSALEDSGVNDDTRYETVGWTYEKWTDQHSPLTKTQKYILESDILNKQPLRIIGSAGSGKSLLMQLIAMRILKQAKEKDEHVNILYIVHNAEMENTIWNKFDALGGEEFLFEGSKQKLSIKTLFEYSRVSLKLAEETIIDKDAYQTKEYQKNVVKDCIQRIFEKRSSEISKSELLTEIRNDHELIDIFSQLISREIGIAIKGRGLNTNRKTYVESEQSFTRMHGALSQLEREIVFDIFESYHSEIFEKLEVLDSDDVALTYLNHLRTALWEMKRKKEGFDFLFVDEAQLFNQNERLLFRLLTKRSTGFLPIAIALDEAQDIYGAQNAGLGLLGIDNIASQTLSTVHRSIPSILKLAFFVIQRTTDLFGSDFPNFAASTVTEVAENHPLAAPPILITENAESSSLGKSVLKEIRELRKNNIWQIAVVVHSDHYWENVKTNLEKQKLPLVVHTKRGEMIDPKAPVVVLTRPENVGGQEFEAVIVVGLERGIVPPHVDGNIGLSEALEQQSLREMYLVFTRAKYRLIIFNSKNSQPNHIIDMAVKDGLIHT